jgi:hypothetical protein
MIQFIFKHCLFFNLTVAFIFYNKKTKVFCIDVTFEMRTVLYGIRLLIDTHQIGRQHFISNRNGGEESMIVERQRECVRGSAWGEEGIASVIKRAVREIHLVGSRWD